VRQRTRSQGVYPNVLHFAPHQPDEAAALAPYPVHDRAPIDADIAIDMGANVRYRTDCS